MSYRGRSVAIVTGGIIADQLLKALYRPETAFVNAKLLGTTTHPTIALVATWVALGVLVWLWWRAGSQSGLLSTGLSLALAGGASNLLDRVLRGAIIDPFTLGTLSFNLADILLSIGTVLVIFYLFIGKHRAIDLR